MSSLSAHKKYFTYKEACSVIYNFPVNGSLEFNQKFLCFFLWHTGMKIAEARNIIVSDIEPLIGVIHIKTSRRKNHLRTIPKDQKFFKELEAYMKLNKINKRGMFLFPGQNGKQLGEKTAWRWVSDACQRAGIDAERGHPHTFRHSFAFNCLLNKIHVHVISKWLGYSDILTTIQYLKRLDPSIKINMDEIAGVK